MAQYEHNSDKFGYINLEELEGVQTALAKLGFDPGTIDGKNGPNTQKAVRAFQAHASIGIDGIVGPETRQALLSELDLDSKEAPATPAAGYEASAPSRPG
ncbi:MAG TPA: peptidoglycan-binding domain-containing protein [Labilithrix sp.]|jgi:peptidoglycan hydrolase-like protein with peptidoglycan-binding domain|nr:peptidoglycan-binding domain-containing protein [Labilithrix sp.]